MIPSISGLTGVRPVKFSQRHAARLVVEGTPWATTRSPSSSGRRIFITLNSNGQPSGEAGGYRRRHASFGLAWTRFINTVQRAKVNGALGCESFLSEFSIDMSSDLANVSEGTASDEQATLRRTLQSRHRDAHALHVLSADIQNEINAGAKEVSACSEQLSQSRQYPHAVQP